MDSINAKNVGNTVYHAAVLSVLTVGVGIGAKKVLGKGIGDLTNPNLTNVGATAVAIGLKGWLETQGLPKEPMKN